MAGETFTIASNGRAKTKEHGNYLAAITEPVPWQHQTVNRNITLKRTDKTGTMTKVLYMGRMYNSHG